MVTAVNWVIAALDVAKDWQADREAECNCTFTSLSNETLTEYTEEFNAWFLDTYTK